MSRAFRLLPALVFGLLVVVALRAAELWAGFSAIGDAWASDSAKHGGEAPKAQPTKPVHEAPLAPPPGATEPMDAHIPSLSPQQQAAPAAAQADDHSPAPDAAPAEPQAAAKPAQHRPIPGEDSFVSASEIEVLESLTKRREELDKREAALDMREKLMRATEQRLDQKLADVKKVQADINARVHTLNQQEAAQIASLVKVYETMKPKDAAEILQGLDKPILVDVAARMKEAKMSAILAAMEPDKAREVTVMLAKRTEIPGIGLTAATAPNP